MKNSRFKSVTDLNRLAHLSNTPLLGMLGNPVMHIGKLVFS